MNTESEIERAVDAVAERGVSHPHFGFFDCNGSLRAKRYAARHLRKGLTEGVPFIALPSGVAPDNRPVPTNPYLRPEHGYRNGALRLDADSVREVPFAGPAGGVLLIGQFLAPDDADCVRSRLAVELQRLAAQGFEVYGGFEMEAAVLLETEEGLASKRAAELRSLHGYDNSYSFVEQAADGVFLDELLGACSQMGIGVDTAHVEFAGMLEAALVPSVGVRIADDAALYRAVAKLAGRRYGRVLSFMARRHGRRQGCGAHINLSLRSLESHESAFHDPHGPHRLSAVARHFVAGLLRFLPELFVLLAPNVNSYKRFRPELFTPLSNTWGIDNKTVAFRIVNAGPASTRVEVRFPGADLCPHLGLAAVLAAGRRGIEAGLEPPAPVEGSGWDVEDAPGEGFPIDFRDAIERFEASALAREAFGEGFVRNFVGDRRWQLRQFDDFVTDWEIRMFGNL